MAEQGPLSKKDTPAFDPSTQASNHHTEGDSSAKEMKNAGSAKRRPYSVAPRPAAAASASQIRESSADERGALSSLSGTLNASFSTSPRKNSFGPSVNESRSNSCVMDSRKSTMIGSRRSTMLGQGGSALGLTSPDSRRGSFPQGTYDELDSINSSRSTLTAGKAKNNNTNNP